MAQRKEDLGIPRLIRIRSQVTFSDKLLHEFSGVLLVN